MRLTYMGIKDIKFYKMQYKIYNIIKNFCSLFGNFMSFAFIIGAV